MKEQLLKVVVIREEYVRLTGSFDAAMVLGQFDHYQHIARGHETLIQQENERSRIHDITDGYIQPTEGWFYKSLDELCEELFNPFKKSKAQEIIQTLIDRGWVMSRSNPKVGYDRVRQYRLNLVKLHRDLREMGLSLQRWDTSGFENRGNPFPPSGNCIPPSGNQFPPAGEQYQREHQSNPENPIPKPFSGGKGLSDSHSPESGGRADWRAAAKRDPGSKVLVDLFPGEGEEWPENIARMFVKRRRAGQLPDGLLNLVARCYRRASDDTDPKQSWKARTIREFMSPSRLDRMGRALRSKIQEDIEERTDELESWREDELTLSTIYDVMEKAKTPEDFPFFMWLKSDPAITVLACRGTPDAKKALVENLRDIENQLCYRRHILTFYRMNATKLPPFEELFGVTEASVQLWHKQYEERKEKEINDLKALL
jgi:hypothetical protein